MGIVVAVTAAALVVLGLSAVHRAAPATSLAPRLSPGYGPALLGRVGFPATAHNVAVLHDHLGAAFLEIARGHLAPDAHAALAARCASARGGVPVAGGSARSWPQRVLDELAAVPALAPGLDVASVPRRGEAALLATVGSGRGVFGGSVFAPLPVRREVPATTGAPATTEVPATAAVPVPRVSRDVPQVAPA